MDPYSRNPFRVLGVRSNASPKEAARGADRLLKWIELGEIPQVKELLPYLDPIQRNREQIKAAVKEIEDPNSRIRSELYWPSSEFSAFQACQDFLDNGRYEELVSQCEKTIADGFAGRKNANTSEPQLDGCLGCQYLAVFYHSAAISASHESAKATADGKPAANWDQAFHYWALIIRNDSFWTYLTNRAQLLNDPRVNATDVERLRRELPLSLLRVNVSRAVASVEREQSEDFIANCIVIRKAQFGSNSDQALKEVTLPLQSRFDKSLNEIQPTFSESAIRMHVPLVSQSGHDTNDRTLDPQKLTAYLAGIEETINKKLVPTGRLVKESGLEQTDPAREILDALAYAFRGLSLAFNNLGGMPHASVRLTEIAKQYARSTECNGRLDEDHRTLQFLSLQKDAIELASASRYRESLAKLNASRQFASSDEENRTIDEWVEVANKRLALEGVKPIKSTPTMYTFNGIGSKLYGKRDFDTHTQSYVATLYFTFVFLPIFPLASYRVRDAGGSRYQFLGKVPLKWTAFIGPVIVALIIAFFIMQGNTDTTTSSPEQSAPSTSVGTPTSGQSLSTDKATLSQWLDQEQARLKSEEPELDSQGNQIELDRKDLQQKADALKSGTASQEEIDSYEADRQRFNAEVDTFNARINRHKSDVAKFNAELDRYNSMP